MDFAEAFTQERRARLAAERMLATKQKELFAANRKLSRHALSLTGEIVQQRGDLELARKEARELRDSNQEALNRLDHAQEIVSVTQKRLWHSLETIPDGISIYDKDSILVAANSAFLAVFDGLECVQPGISYEEILALLVEEGTVDTEGKRPAEWQEFMLDRWHRDDLRPRNIHLWTGQCVQLLDRRHPNGDTVSLALGIAANSPVPVPRNETLIPRLSV